MTFTCTDAGSGLQIGGSPAAPVTPRSANDGAGPAVHGDAVDVAGNKSGTDVTGINIDKTKPTLSGVPPRTRTPPAGTRATSP